MGRDLDAIPKTRLETFSDGVIAIIITIMGLEMKAPPGADLAALQPLAPVLLSYAAAIALAFINPWFSDALYVFVALLGLIPDRRIERLAQP